MESPPPYKAKKSNTGLIVGIIIGAVVVCCIVPGALMAGGGLWAFGKVKGVATCGIAFDDVGKALNQYVAAHDGKLPSAKTWQDDLRPYYQKISGAHPSEGGIPIMPATGNWGCSSEGVTSGFAFNSEVSGKSVSSLKDSDMVVIFEQTKSAPNLSMKYEAPSFASSPKMFGQNRGWMVITANGQSGMVDKTGKVSDVNFNAGSSFNVKSSN